MDYLEYREKVQKERERFEKPIEFKSGLMRFTDRKIYYYDAFIDTFGRKPGNWGYINNYGDVVISPQYIFADDFADGIAFVCKGEWIKDDFWHIETRVKHTGAKWGAIDTEGNEVIPFIYDDVEYFEQAGDIVTEYFKVYVKENDNNGHWGIINRKGEWVVPPEYFGFGSDFRDGLVLYHREESFDAELPTLGVYDILKNKVVIEARYEDIFIRKDGLFEVRTFDDEEMVIDLNGEVVEM